MFYIYLQWHKVCVILQINRKQVNKDDSKEVIPKVQQDLFAMQDLKYRDFHAKLMPTVEKESVIGVRVPVLRTYAKEIREDRRGEAVS